MRITRFFVSLLSVALVFVACKDEVEYRRNKQFVPMRLIKTFVLFLVLSLHIGAVNAQEEHKHSIRFSVPIFYLKNFEEWIEPSRRFAGDLVEFSSKFEYSYRISSVFAPFVYVSVGIHRGEAVIYAIGKRNSPADSYLPTMFGFRKRSGLGIAPSLSYGIGTRVHFLNLFGDRPIARRLDPYISTCVGGYTMFSTARTRKGCVELENELKEMYWLSSPSVSPKGTSVEQQSMLGLNLFLSKKFGFWAEFGYVTFKYYNGFRANYGLVFRF